MSGGCNSISHDGITYIRWIHTIFGSCVYGNREVASYMLGYVSIACWLNAQLPQLITNYKNKSVDGLSLPFLVNWLLGDITNLIGCILTGQLKFQIYLAAYFCVVDFILFFQYFYYTWIRKPTIPIVESGELPYDLPIRPLSTQSLKDSILEGARKSYTFPSRKNQSHQRVSSMVFVVLLFTFHSTSSISSSYSTSPHLSTTHDEIESQSILPGMRLFFENNSMVIGRIMAWICTVLYLTSRMPQIWKNYTRKSVEGLSIFMFIFAAIGNLTYTMSILLKSTDPEYIREEIPYILGSVGTLTFDVTIFIQWCIMRDPEYRRKRRRSRRSGSYGTDSTGYYQLPTDEGSYRNERRSRNGRSSSQINDGNVV